MLGLARKLFGSSNDRILRQFAAQVEGINAHEEGLKALSDEELQNKTGEFRTRIQEGATLDSLLPEAFAVVREAAWRALSMRHFDVQLVGGIVLHRGMIAEMKTGEGKTLVCTLPAYLNALEGKGVHVVTVNDYLAKRDSEWMGEVHRFLGLTVGCITHDMDDMQRKVAYACDITYGTNNEYGFDYLRDNMKYSLEEMVQRPFNFAVVDEVDSILIDEARTPLIISGPTEDNSELYVSIDALIPELGEDDYEIDEKGRSVTLTEEGQARIEEMLAKHELIEAGSNLYDIENVSVVHHVNQSLRAHKLFNKDVDYIVKDNKVIIIDEFTGRMMEGRRYSEGLHQALEAKENAHIQNENQTLASITFQNYFRLYPKLSGMTGTALTEAAEFADIYKLAVIEIPTHVDLTRIDHDDEIYRTADEKYNAIVEHIAECYTTKQPVLVGTVSIEKSELLSELLKKKKVPHHVLNARYHEKEAQIIAQAGRLGAVTIATNMAGRGTDIMLGGNPDMRIEEELGEVADDSVSQKKVDVIRAQVKDEKAKVLEAGGLYVMGTERHESRRIDNQLRGRSGRQGDPGTSKFFLSLEDDLMRIFGSERMDYVLQKLGLQEGEAIYHPWMSKALEKAQRKVESRNYDIRKNLLKYDDVMNDQRKVIYEQRKDILDTEDLSESIEAMREEVVDALIAATMPPRSYPEQWDMEHLEKECFRLFTLHLPVKDWAAEEGIADTEMHERIAKAFDAHMQEKEERFTPELMRLGEKRVLLHSLDQLWKDHLHSLDHLRQGITLRAYGQRDPLNEYKQEAFSLFEYMLDELREKVSTRLARLEVRVDGEAMPQTLPMAPATFDPDKMKMGRRDPGAASIDSSITSGFGGTDSVTARVVPLRNQVKPEDRNAEDPESWGKVGRNEACPCGSGKKFKYCHGQLG